jgi:hypothetical protein
MHSQDKPSTQMAEQAREKYVGSRTQGRQRHPGQRCDPAAAATTLSVRLFSLYSP